MTLFTLSKFQIGTFLITESASEELVDNSITPFEYLALHSNGVSIQDPETHTTDLTLEDRLKTTHHTDAGTEIALITSAKDRYGNRKQTILMLASEVDGYFESV
jgi:hypothetical protein